MTPKTGDSPSKLIPLGRKAKQEIQSLRKRWHGAVSRQDLRHALYRKCFWDVTREFGGESRAQRKRIARRKSKRMYRELMGLEISEAAIQNRVAA